MSDITKKFDDFKSKKVDKFNKDKQFQPLSDDIVVFKTNDDSFEKIKGVEKIEGSIKIISITDIIKDPEKIKKLNEITESPENININTDLNEKELSRNDIIWLMAYVQKTNNSKSVKSQTHQAIIKCKISDFGLFLVK